ncbi:hypothetical protein M5D96_012985 [Drosophila gunungcola]|uniref:Uncharacterized protein n=1 Tax=Drosophila gunungcola TaxID=103775 RepID=A0A9P9YC75_9MUSC|nr:hypothetical protein M5D96_012985 [Drosophila gunungcola]
MNTASTNGENSEKRSQQPLLASTARLRTRRIKEERTVGEKENLT